MNIEEFLDWLNAEIGKPLPPMLGGKSIHQIHEAKVRRETLREVKDKLLELEKEQSHA